MRARPTHLVCLGNRVTGRFQHPPACGAADKCRAGIGNRAGRRQSVRVATSALTLVVGVAFLCFAGQQRPAAAAAPTPTLTPSPTCDVPPRSIAEIESLLAAPVATPPATTGGATLPVGEPANADETARIAETVRGWLACQNRGEQLRAWSFFTDGYLRRLLARQRTVGTVPVATPGPAPESALLQQISGERRLPDGRLGALVRIAYSSVPMPKTFFFTFVQDQDRLLIDGILGEISFSVP